MLVGLYALEQPVEIGDVRPGGRFGIRVQVPESELNTGEEVLQYSWIPEDVGVVAERAVKHASFAVAVDPAQREFAIFAVAVAGATALVHIGLCDVDAEQDVDSLARRRRL